jgi:hypothetical protein
MIRKLFSYVRDECKAEDQDAPSMHEILLPGHLYLALLSVNMLFNNDETVFDTYLLSCLGTCRNMATHIT